MQHLAIDTTSNFTKLAVFNTKTKASFTVNEKTDLTQASTLMPLIDDLLNQANLTMKQIDTIIVNLGPGPYTSLRIGIAAAKGLALPFETKIIGVNNFDIYKYLYINESDLEDSAILIQNTPKQAYLQINNENKIADLKNIDDLIPTGIKIYGNGVDYYNEYLSNFQTVENTSEIKPMDLINFVLNTKYENTDITPLYIKPLSYRKSS